MASCGLPLDYDTKITWPQCTQWHKFVPLCLFVCYSLHFSLITSTSLLEYIVIFTLCICLCEYVTGEVILRIKHAHDCVSSPTDK